MKAKLLTLLALLIVCGAATALDFTNVLPGVPAPTAPLQQAGKKIPAISFTAQDGRKYSLADLPEKGIVLHFWASWCAPCALEFPSLLEKIRQAHGDLALVAVSIEDRRTDMDKFLARLKNGDDPHVFWVWDKGKDISLKQFDTVRAPESVLIDARRRMVDKIAGDPGWTGPAMAARLRALAGP
jgi:thiol-disulfide isomerase/thioredoxin